MLLSDLLDVLPDDPCHQRIKSDIQITGIHYDSRKIQAGNVFVAIRGNKTDGHEFINNALDNGASVIIVETMQSVLSHVIQIQVTDSRKALACLAARYYKFPSNHLCLIGITGTNGKTTTAYLIENILKSNGHPTGVISTIEYRYQGNVFPNPLTTPESLDLQRIFSEMLANGITHVVMEVSSHALDLDRVHGCFFNVSVFTNLSQDHLDYHQTMEDYWACKKRLFFPPFLTQQSLSVINCDNNYGCQLKNDSPGKQILVGSSDENHIYCQNPDISLSLISGKIFTPKGIIALSSALTGQHNVQNILCAVGVGIALNIPLAAIEQGITGMTCIPGRLERITEATDRFVFVDYAHTPDALENVIHCIKHSSPGRIITVFGCGGDRDRSKRPIMGKVAATLSNLCIVTSDNPRTELAGQIINDICSGIPDQHEYKIEPDRKKAIKLALLESRPKDVILIAGKGHETYQILNDQTIHFDDREHARILVKCLYP
ncbi:MAG: UDP-N-acetylmuramoyl-L-alanyl-D-glutamate--2,6-diaminopimelate ligase [Candidatus Magnetomorum sp.]|nr:UDP-N-acetylmuramoyl-L-alanyl-D-glutamate--2,6-diaminopimelate ligase [Candidatus Magnetomorum sp.]